MFQKFCNIETNFRIIRIFVELNFNIKIWE